MRKICILLFAGICITVPLSAAPVPNQDSVFVQGEKKLKVLADSILRGSTEAVRVGAMAEFNPVFWDLLNMPGAFDYGFDSLTSVSKIRSADQRLRILTWILPSRDGESYSYYGVVQVAGNENQSPQTSGLTEVKTPAELAVATELNPGTWYGAVYYDIIETRLGKQTIYTLLGWHGNNRHTTRKVIDVLIVDTYRNLTFGAPIFKTDTGQYNYRVIFEYSANAVMLLHYEKGMKMIVFDHLSPASPGMKDNYENYGPDFTYDGYRFKKGKWDLKKNLELNNPTGTGK